MVLKFLASKKGGGIGAVDYVLSPDRVKDGTAIVLKGDEKITRELIAGIDNKQKTTFAVLSFEEKDIPEAEKFKLMRVFERTFFAGMKPEKYNVLWVQHTDKGRLELNCIIPKIELTTGKAYNPYYHTTDLHLADMFQTWANIEHGYSDPKDPAKKTVVVGKRGKFTTYNGYRGLDKTLRNMVAAGTIQDRGDMIAALKEIDIKVIAVTDDYIEIQLAEDKNGKRPKPRKLQGHGIYTARFTGHDELSEIAGEQAQREGAFAGRSDRGEGRQIGRRLAKSILKRSRVNKARFRYEEPKARNDSRRDETRQREVARGVEGNQGSPVRIVSERAREQRNELEGSAIVRGKNEGSSQQRPRETQEARKPIPMGLDQGEINDRTRTAITEYARSREARSRARARRSSERTQRTSLYASIGIRGDEIRVAATTTDHRAIAEAVRGRQLRSYLVQGIKQLPDFFNSIVGKVVERVKELTKPIDKELVFIQNLFDKNLERSEARSRLFNLYGLNNSFLSV